MRAPTTTTASVSFVWLIPQDTRTNMTPEQISGLRKDLENLLKGKCKDLVEAMLKNVKGGGDLCLCIQHVTTSNDY